MLFEPRMEETGVAHRRQKRHPVSKELSAVEFPDKAIIRI